MPLSQNDKFYSEHIPTGRVPGYEEVASEQEPAKNHLTEVIFEGIRAYKIYRQIATMPTAELDEEERQEHTIIRRSVHAYVLWKAGILDKHLPQEGKLWMEKFEADFANQENPSVDEPDPEPGQPYPFTLVESLGTEDLEDPTLAEPIAPKIDIVISRGGLGLVRPYVEPSEPSADDK